MLRLKWLVVYKTKGEFIDSENGSSDHIFLFIARLYQRSWEKQSKPGDTNFSTIEEIVSYL